VFDVGKMKKIKLHETEDKKLRNFEY